LPNRTVEKDLSSSSGFPRRFSAGAQVLAVLVAGHLPTTPKPCAEMGHSSLLHLHSGFRLLISVRRSKFTRRTAKTSSGIMNKIDFAVGIGGENGQGIASTGNILALIFARRGLHLNAYNAYQSIIRGGHTFLTIRASDGPVRSMG